MASKILPDLLSEILSFCASKYLLDYNIHYDTFACLSDLLYGISAHFGIYLP